MYKNIIKSAVSLFLLFGLAQSGAAQIDKVIDRTTQRIENKVTNNINTKIDRGVDKTVDKVLNPNKNKTTTPTTPSKTTSPTTTTTDQNSGSKTKIPTTSDSGISTALDNSVQSSFVGTFQWEVKRYKSDKLVAGGHTLVDFYIKDYDVAVHILNPAANNKRETGYVLDRRENKLVVINETDGTATHNQAKWQVSPTLNIIPMMETKMVGGVSCAKYMGENAEIAVTLWVDETERVAMASCLKNGMGIARAEFDLLPFLASMKTPVREALLVRKKTGEKTQIWLNQYSKTSPDAKAFDYSRYMQK
jgi:hypothetical protein